MVSHRPFFVLQAIIPLSAVFQPKHLPIKCPWQRGMLYALNHIGIFQNYFLNPIRSIPIWRSLPELVVSRPNRQNRLPNKVSDLK
jgi:hypothetical protein